MNSTKIHAMNVECLTLASSSILRVSAGQAGPAEGRAGGADRPEGGAPREAPARAGGAGEAAADCHGPQARETQAEETGAFSCDAYDWHKKTVSKREVP